MAITILPREKDSNKSVPVIYNGLYNNPRAPHIETTTDDLVGKRLELFAPHKHRAKSGVWCAVCDILHHRTHSQLRHQVKTRNGCMWVKTHFTIGVFGTEAECDAFLLNFPSV